MKFTSAISLSAFFRAPVSVTATFALLEKFLILYSRSSIYFSARFMSVSSLFSRFRSAKSFLASSKSSVKSFKIWVFPNFSLALSLPAAPGREFTASFSSSTLALASFALLLMTVICPSTSRVSNPSSPKYLFTLSFLYCSIRP